MEIIKGDLILTKNKEFKESIRVEGNIKGDFSLKVAGNIDARNIDTWDIKARDIDAGNIDAGNIDARDIDAGNIDARDIKAWDIKAWDIKARDIDAGNIDARNIDAWDIKARDIDAWDIIFSAFCISRKSLKCKSIKGLRKNCLYKCLDKEIEFKKKVCDKYRHEL